MKRCILTLLGLILIAAIGSQLWYFGQVLRLRYHDPEQTAFIARASQHGPVDYRWRDYVAISDNLKRAVVVSEDAHFTQHWGFSWKGIRRAIKRNQAAGHPVAGGSTITQQLAKNLFLSGERTYTRKAQEALIALMLELTLSKRRILELYLNVAQFGIRVFGAEAAARHYFGVHAATLTPEQAAELAIMLPRPNYYDLHGTTDYMRQRTHWVVRQLQLVKIPPDGTRKPAFEERNTGDATLRVPGSGDISP